MEFNEKIKMLRKQRCLSLQAVGDIVGVGKSTVRKWENGDIKNMGRDKIALLAKALGVEPGYLMGWENENGELNEAREHIMPRSKEWRMLSEGFEEFEKEKKDEFMMVFNMLSKTYPEFFTERNDDDDPES